MKLEKDLLLMSFSDDKEVKPRLLRRKRLLREKKFFDDEEIQIRCSYVRTTW
jgi:hypothetical protein